MAEDKKKAKEGEAEAEAKPEGEAAPAKAGFLSKKLIVFVIAPVMLLLIGGGAAHFLGVTAMLFGGGHDDHAAEAKHEPPKPVVFYNLPELLVNLNSQGRRASYLKISISLELADAGDVPKVEAVLPRIVDQFQIYLRELRIEDLRGSAGLYRLREELLQRVNTAAQPARINDVLFKEMLVQ